MGQVWRARHSALKRDDALKVLPDTFAADPERLDRFQREAQILASLNHPNIAVIHGLEEAGSVKALVMELVEGPTLADRIVRGPLPVDESLSIAKQMAEALEAAHEKSIIHRDLKPANVKSRPDGLIKVLDFGLAKLVEAGEPGSANGLMLSNSPTMMASVSGLLLGTAAYMSPEQACGKPVDKRADIWAFGCVLYEMLTGHPTFAGSSVSAILAAVIRDEPDWTRLPIRLHPNVQRLLQRCLDKDPRTRWRDIGDVRIEIERTQRDDKEPHVQSPMSRHAAWKPTAVVAAVSLAIGLVVGATLWSIRTTPVATGTGRGTATAGAVALPATMSLAQGAAAVGIDSPMLSLSPDGEWLVYVGRGEGRSRLYRRRLNRFETPEPIAGTDGAIHAFFAPDGQSVGFLTDDRVKRVSLAGDNLQTIAPTRTALRATWTESGWIYLVEDQGINLRRVRSTGGDVEDVLIGSGWRFSDVLADGRFALATARQGSVSGDYSAIMLVNLATKQPQVLSLSGYDPRWVPTGHLMFGRSGNLMIVPIDLEPGAVQGNAVPLLRDVAMDSMFLTTQAAISSSGTLAYVPGADRGIGRIVTIDRAGRDRVLPAPPNKYGMFDLSPTDTALAVHVADVRDYVWIYDLTRQEGRKVVGSDGHGFPEWNPAGTALAFSSGHIRLPGSTLMVQTMRGGSPPEIIHTSDNAPIALIGWSPTADDVTVYDFNSQRLGLLSLKERRSIRWIDRMPGHQGPGHFSPDGRWLAYVWDESGRNEIWIASYPDFDNRRQLSTGGGVEPIWCPCGELFFRRGNQFFSSAVRWGPDFSAEPARLVFEVSDFLDTPGISFDVSSDGQTLYVIKRAEPAITDRVHVIANWFDELEGAVPRH